MDNSIDVTAPAIIASLSWLSVFLFEQPTAVFMTALGGAMWAIWLTQSTSLWRSALYILVAAVTACSLVALAVWALNLAGFTNPPVRGLAGLIAFIIIHKPWRDKVLSWIGVKINEVGK